MYQKTSLNINIVECKVLKLLYLFLYLIGLNINIVECKERNGYKEFTASFSLNINIVECKDKWNIYIVWC